MRLWNGDGVAAIDLDLRWRITGNLNGGYLAAVLGAAGAAEFGADTALTVSAHFLAPVSRGGPAEVDVDVVRRGRMSVARVTLVDDGVRAVEALVTVGAPAPGGPTLAHAEPPPMPAWEECPDVGRAAGSMPGMDLFEHLALRIHPADGRSLATGEPLPRAVARAWVSYRDGRPVDPVLLMAAWDVLPPAPWLAGVVGRLPTAAAQVVVLPGPVAGPLLVESRCETLHAGVCDETARVWDSTGRLVSSARQTAILLDG